MATMLAAWCPLFLLALWSSSLLLLPVNAFYPPVFHDKSFKAARPPLYATTGGGPSLPSLDLLQKVKEVAIEACREAGPMIKEKAGASVKNAKFNAKDLVTEVDGATQVIIERHVRAAFPEHEFLGEENVPPGPEASTKALQEMLNSNKGDGWLWICDPIDGTTNFIHGMPLSAISIGVAYKGEVVVGVIYDPFADELFTAIRGQGAFLNGKRIHVGEQDKLIDALVAAGCPPTLESLWPSLRGINALAPQVRSLRLLGSAAIMLAWVACGRLTSYWEPDLNSWDTAGGSILIEEAGGIMSCMEQGKRYSLTTRAIIGSNGKTHEAIRKVLVDANAGRLEQKQ